MLTGTWMSTQARYCTLESNLDYYCLAVCLPSGMSTAYFHRQLQTKSGRRFDSLGASKKRRCRAIGSDDLLSCSSIGQHISTDCRPGPQTCVLTGEARARALSVLKIPHSKDLRYSYTQSPLWGHFHAVSTQLRSDVVQGSEASALISSRRKISCLTEQIHLVPPNHHGMIPVRTSRVRSSRLPPTPS